MDIWIPWMDLRIRVWLTLCRMGRQHASLPPIPKWLMIVFQEELIPYTELLCKLNELLDSQECTLWAVAVFSSSAGKGFLQRNINSLVLLCRATTFADPNKTWLPSLSKLTPTCLELKHWILHVRSNWHVERSLEMCLTGANWTLKTGSRV